MSKFYDKEGMEMTLGQWAQKLEDTKRRAHEVFNPQCHGDEHTDCYLAPSGDEPKQLKNPEKNSPASEP